MLAYLTSLSVTSSRFIPIGKCHGVAQYSVVPATIKGALICITQLHPGVSATGDWRQNHTVLILNAESEFVHFISD